jgi:selenocysteine-specific elongation factor
VKAIIGTAGHIDHGKSALVRALTGIETDRLPQERERGISIELGFAYLELPDGDRAGIVDVPGHERFVRQMLAGAQGFDLMLMVVAADDGVMPQTEEHFEICHLLGVRRGMFVITKTDLVTPQRVADVRGDIEILAVGTEFEHAPTYAVSAQTGAGMDELRTALLAALADLERGEAAGPYRMPVDRSFVIKGHGTVVTGTAAGGCVSLGDELEVVPSGARARVREIQVHEQPVERAWSGQRVALNLAGIEREGVARGCTMVSAGLDATTQRFDARVEIRPAAAKAVRSHARVRVYAGTAELDGKLIWLDGRDSVAPREIAYAQIALERPIVLLAHDRFVLRDETASRTLGGGEVVVARASRHRRRDGEVAPLLAAVERGSSDDRVRALVEMAGGLGVAPSALALAIGRSEIETRRLAAGLDGLLLLPDADAPVLVASRARFASFVAELVEKTRAFHDANPKASGMDLERLRQSVSHELDARLFRTLIDELLPPATLVRRGGKVALAGHTVSIDAAEQKLAERILAAVSADPTTPPSLKELQQGLAVDAKRLMELVGVLCERGDLVKVSGDLVFAAEVVREAELALREYLSRNDRITAAEFRDLISASRKYSIPLLDYFDRCGVTLRSGDYRRLR